MQSVPGKWDLKQNFAVFLEMLEIASKNNADIFITPECWLDGYAAADELSTPAKLRTVAQPLAGSPYLDRVAREASERDMYICLGFSSLENGRIYNASGLWDNKGNLRGVYHKTHLQTHDLQYEFGQALPVWDTPWGPLGIMICADRRWPETARTLRLQGARLILNPTYGMHHEANEWWMRTRGFENQCFIAFTHPNVGFVVGPKGNVTAKRDERPGVLIAEVDLSRAKDDNHLRDRRPELYRAITEHE
jgi:N-carbamoylputrescine amidase